MQPNQSKRLSPAIISIIVIALLAVAAGTVYFVSNKETATETTQSTTTETTPETVTDETETAETGTAAEASSEYTDGSYTETGSYSTPGGTETLTVTATLEGGIVKSVSATGSAKNGNSKQYQSEFLSAYQSKVVGKSVDEISLSRVAGSSLTSTGFNKALEAIKADATS